jgi:hypothetical protein
MNLPGQLAFSVEKDTVKRVAVVVIIFTAIVLASSLGYPSSVLIRDADSRQGQNVSSKALAVPSIKAKDLNGKDVIITFKQVRKPTVLYIFTHTCRWCDRNWQSINTLAKLSGKSYRFIGLSLVDDGLNNYLTTHKLDFPVYTKLSPDSVSALGLGSTPQTIIISPEGRSLKNWLGAYGTSLRSEIESYFRVKLPGNDIQDSDSSLRCVYCIRNGSLSSPGAVAKVGDRRIRCKQDGQWTDPY